MRYHCECRYAYDERRGGMNINTTCIHAFSSCPPDTIKSKSLILNEVCVDNSNQKQWINGCVVHDPHTHAARDMESNVHTFIHTLCVIMYMKAVGKWHEWYWKRPSSPGALSLFDIIASAVSYSIFSFFCESRAGTRVSISIYYELYKQKPTRIHCNSAENQLNKSKRCLYF